jgi:predicted O-methyltransferase YrrM
LPSPSARTVPVFINCRDRVTPLLALIDYLERAGCERIHLLDNDSTYPPLLEYYEHTPHTVIRLGENFGSKALWQSGVLDRLGVDGRYAYSDPDVVPIEECPLDAIDYFAEVLERYPGHSKAGFGLKLDDLPDHFRNKDKVVAWESKFWQRMIAPRLYDAPIDTTFALYRSTEHAPNTAIRTGYPYLVRHTTWYWDSENLSEENRYYVDRGRITTWTRDEMVGGPEANPERWHQMNKRLEKIAARPPVPRPVKAKERDAGSPAALVQSAWQAEPDPVPEAAYSPAAGSGWRAWNGHSPEVEFCEFVATMVRLVQPALVVETGTGQGFVTRRIGESIGAGRLLCFESDPEWRAALAALPFFDGETRTLSDQEQPAEKELAGAELTVLDSDFLHRAQELKRWWVAARPGAVVLVHGAANGHAPETPQARLGALIRELGIPGAFLKTPRGGFLGLKP